MDEIDFDWVRDGSFLRILVCPLTPDSRFQKKIPTINPIKTTDLRVSVWLSLFFFSSQ